MRKLKAAISNKLKEQNQRDSQPEFQQAPPQQQNPQSSQQRQQSSSQFRSHSAPWATATASLARQLAPVFSTPSPPTAFRPPAPIHGQMGPQYHPSPPVNPAAPATSPHHSHAPVHSPAQGPLMPITGPVHGHPPPSASGIQPTTDAELWWLAEELADVTSTLAITNPIPTTERALEVKEASSSIHCRWCEKCKKGITYGSNAFICTKCRYWLCRSCSDAHKSTHPQRVRTQLLQWTRFCGDCKSEVTCEDVRSIECAQCKHWVCGACSDGHQAAHVKGLQVERSPKVEKFAVEASPCRVCSQEARARLECECKLCGFALCLPCFQNPAALEKFFSEHAAYHTKKKEMLPAEIQLLAIYPERWRVLKQWREEVCHCQDQGRPAATMHCERCHLALEVGKTAYWCRVCHKEWGGFTQWLCESCFQEDEEWEKGISQRGKEREMKNGEKQIGKNPKLHDHVFIKAFITFDATIPDERAEAMRCPTCELWLGEVDRTRHYHDHVNPKTNILKRTPDLKWIVSPRLQELYRYSLYKNCDKEALFKGTIQYPDTVSIKSSLGKCKRCDFVLAYNKPATLCTKTGCQHYIYCASCTENRSVNHRHTDSTYVVVMKRQRALQVAQVDCVKCRKRYKNTGFYGLFCGHCSYFALCWRCIADTCQGKAPEHPPGLRHPEQRGHECPAKNWVLFYEGGKMPGGG